MRALKALVIVMGVLIVVGVTVLGITIANRMSRPAPSPPPVTSAPAPAPPTPVTMAPPAAVPPVPPGSALNLPIGTPLPPQFDRKFGDITLKLPPGARVSDFSAAGDRLVMRVIMADQEQRLFVVDLLTGDVLGTIRLATNGDVARPQGAGNGAADGNPGILPPLPSVNVPPRNKSEGLK